MTYHQHPSIYPKHVHLYVSDITKSGEFYSKILGLHILNQNQFIINFTVNDSDCLLTIEQPKDYRIPELNAPGLYHMAFLVPSKEDLADVFTHIQRSGYPLSGASDHKVSEALYLNDLDGNGIEIYYDRKPDTWNWENNQVEMTIDRLDIDNLLATASQKVWTGMSSGTIIGHVHLRVENMEKAEKFYVYALGFDIVSRYGSQATFISSNGYHHHLALNTWGRPKTVDHKDLTLGLHAFSLVYPSLETRQLVVSRLLEIGADVTEENDIVCAIDPSGTKVLLVVE